MRNVSRRNFLAATGAVGVAGLAGCMSGDDGNGDDNSNGNDNSNGGDEAAQGDESTSSESESLSGDIAITGSSTVYPVSVAVAEEFQKEHSGVNISVDSTGSGGGFSNHFCPGNSHINGASRPIKDEEVENCQSNDVEPMELRIAGDALTVAVNPEADWVDSITYDELAQIWGPDGAERWSDVRDDWPDEEFELYGPASTSGTFDWFTENVVGEAGAHRTDYEATEKDNQLVQGITGSQYAMGYFGFAYYKENEDRLKGLKVSEGDGEGAMPSLENAKSGDYPMARPLFIYPDENKLDQEQLAEFLRYYLNQSETDLVSQIGYVPSSAEQRDENLDKVEEAINNA